VASLPPEDTRPKNDWRRRKGSQSQPAGSPPENTDIEWLALAQLTSLQSAEMVLEVLLDKDIPAALCSSAGHAGPIGAMGPSSYVTIGGAFVIMVAEDAAEDADLEAEAILGEEWVKARLVDFDS
ncbi:MAG: hypothetical protein GY867_09940, partial [bacterium]|nr:hypothetical protein [bacterium]